MNKVVSTARAARELALSLGTRLIFETPPNMARGSIQSQASLGSPVNSEETNQQGKSKPTRKNKPIRTQSRTQKLNSDHGAFNALKTLFK